MASGSKKTAKAVTANKKPTAKVKSLSKPAIGEVSAKVRKLTAKWKIPTELKDKKSAKRATEYFATWRIVTSPTAKRPSGSNAKALNDYMRAVNASDQLNGSHLQVTPSSSRSETKKVKQKITSGKDKGKTKTVSVTIAKGPKTSKGEGYVFAYKIGGSSTSVTQKLDRSAFYPFEGKPYLNSVQVSVQARNQSKTMGPEANSSKLAFSKPKKPEMSLSFNTSNGKLTAAVEMNSTGVYERYDTCWWFTRKDSFTKTYKSEKVLDKKEYSTTDKFSKAKDIADYRSLDYSDWILVTVRAFNRGFMGNSTTVKKTRYLSYPARPVITSIDCKPEGNKAWDSKAKKYVTVPNTSRNGRITVNFRTNAEAKHPVDSVELEVLQNTTIATATEAAESSQWNAVSNQKDNGTCTALADTYANSYPDDARRVWYRIKAMHDDLVRYSEPFQATALYHTITVPDAEVVDVQLVSETLTGSSPQPAGFYVVYGMKSKKNRTGTEVAWDTTLFSAISTNSPQAFQNAGLVSKSTADKWNKKYNKNLSYYGHVYVAGLEEGGKYYIGARNYLDRESGEPKYGKYSYWKKDGKVEAVTFALKPRNVSMTLPSAVTYGKEFSVFWTFESNLEQTHFTLYYVVPKRDSKGKIVYKSGSTTEAETEEKPLRAKVKSNSNAAIITADELERAVYVDENKKNKLVLRVEVEVSGLSAKSSNATATVNYPPSVGASIPSGTLTAQPLTVSYEFKKAKQVQFTVKADGVTDQRPDGEVVQAPGDVIKTLVLSVDGDGSGTYTFPTLDLIDASKYTVEVVAKGPAGTGLESEVKTLAFVTSWSHQAMPPGDLSYVSGSSDGTSVVIRPAKPENWAEGDVCDVYRVTPDGAYLIAESVNFGKTVIDRYAPYSKSALLRYRLCTRTPDGDLEWRDFGYSLRGYCIRFDWGANRTVSLPYNLKYSDTFTKAFTKKTHLDGTRTGWWNPGVDRKGSLSTELVRLADPEVKELVRELAQYPGDVFVRTPDGCAYQANVNVTNFETSYDSLVVPVSFEAEEIDLTRSFMVRDSDIR